jgi:hypothetical protein
MSLMALCDQRVYTYVHIGVCVPYYYCAYADKYSAQHRAHTHTRTRTYTHLCVCVCVRARGRPRDRVWLSFRINTSFLTPCNHIIQCNP